jgi:hypothetical protein
MRVFTFFAALLPALCSCGGGPSFEAMPGEVRAVGATSGWFTGSIGEANDLHIEDAAPATVEKSHYLSVGTWGRYPAQDGEESAMTIVSVSSRGAELADVLTPGAFFRQRADGGLAGKNGDAEGDEVVVEIVGCAGDPEGVWYDRPASEVELRVSRAEVPPSVVVEYAAQFENAGPYYPANTRVTGAFTLVPSERPTQQRSASAR